MLRGRTAECAALDRLLLEAQAGRSQALVLRGEPGIGKTALLDYLAERASGWRVIRAAGVESETEFAYSGLHQLCTPMLDRIGQLPPPQHDALAIVFGRAIGAAPDRFLVGLSALSLFAVIADERPLVCIVDDTQWFDRVSVQILGFLARRLLAERIALVCAARADGSDDILAGLPELQIEGLGDAEARALLLSNVHGPLDDAVCDQLVIESHGNPLALLELPRTWNSANLAGGFGFPAGQQLAGKIEQSYARRLVQLPYDSQLLVLAMAAEPSGDLPLLHRVAERLGVDVAAVDPAVDAGLIKVGSRVEFAHPLVRSAAYQAAASEDRRRVHGALAQSIDAERDPDRRVWHRARAASGPTEEIAAELERSAGRAQARGGAAAAAAFLAKAVDLTPDPTTRARRALDAAFANVFAGTFGSARDLLSVAGERPVDELHQARIDLLEAQLARASSVGSKAATPLLAAARRLEGVDVKLARQTYLDAYITASFGSRFNADVGVAEVAQAARSAPRPPNAAPTAGDLLLDVFSALVVGDESAVPIFRSAVQRLVGDDIKGAEHWSWLWHGAVLALELWDDESAFAVSQRAIQLARERGALHELARGLSAPLPLLIFSGEVKWASSLIAEVRELRALTGGRAALYSPVLLAAWRGQESETRSAAEEAANEAHNRGEGIGIAASEYARAVLCNGLGRYEEAFQAASRAVEDPRELLCHNWGLTELIESATRVDRRDVATDALGRLARKSRASGTDWALGIEARSRALVSEGDAAEAQYREAIDRLTRTRVRAELGRAYLLYGEWLRRQGRRLDAREQLSTAHEMLAAMGIEAYAERARRELISTGGKARKRSDDARDDLTPQEEQIARLARDGLSNRDIGAQLFLSARTVEWHLHNVFVKLAISSRRQLPAALPDIPAVSAAQLMSIERS